MNHVSELPSDVQVALRKAHTHAIYCRSYIAEMTDILRTVVTTEGRRSIISEIARAKQNLKEVEEVIEPYSHLEAEA